MAGRWSYLLLSLTAITAAVVLQKFCSPNFAFYPRKSADVTAVVLNWSRLPNVKQISSLLCDEPLKDIISILHIWNNSPQELLYSDFPSCQPSQLKITNSRENLYFRARFMACAQATTRYCFIQDDDYIIEQDIIKTLRSQVPNTRSGIHLLPSHELLTTTFRTIYGNNNLHTSFSWLGHGAMIFKSQAVDFLKLLTLCNATEDEVKMADNYFTILRNDPPVNWFDQGIELGGGEPFTVGSEGEKRNRRHITRATYMLDDILTRIDNVRLPYIIFENSVLDLLARTPCKKSMCLLETSISLLPEKVASTDVITNATDMLTQEARRRALISDKEVDNYLNHPPSMAVDARVDTFFRGYSYAKKGDIFTLHGTRLSMGARLQVDVDRATESILAASEFYAFDGTEWSKLMHELACVDYTTGSVVRRCIITPESPTSGAIQSFRGILQTNLRHYWCIYELQILY